MSDIHDASKNGRRYAIWIFLAGLVLLLYLPTISFDFVNLDDNRYVTENPQIEGLSVEHIVWAFTTGDVSNWHPLTWLSHMLDYAVFGMHAGGHHFTSVLFHLANAILLFEWLRRITGTTWRSAFVAALFAVHPLHVESVAWVSERKDVVSTFFGFLSLLSYATYIRKPNAGRYALTLAFLILGLLAKPMLVTLPFAMLLLDYWPLRRNREWSWPKLVVEKIPLFLAAAASSAVTLYVQQQGGSVMALEKFPFGARLCNALVAYVAYLRKTVWPSDLAAFYPHPGTSLSPVVVALALGILVVFSVAAVLLTRKRPYIGVGWLWYLGTLVPTIGIVQVGLQSMADRYTYVPLIGIFIVVAWGAFDIATRWPFLRWPLISGSGLVVLLLSLVSVFQIQYWRNTETLFDHAIAVTENNWLAHYNLGTMQLHDQRLYEAIRHFRETIRIDPEHANGHNNLGTALYLEGHYDEAAAEFAKAVELDPSIANARYNLATALSALGKDEEAVPEFEQSILLDAENPDIRYNFGNSLMHLKRYEEAAKQYREALRLRPDYVDAKVNLGTVLLDSGNANEAIQEYSEAARLAPNRVDAFSNLAYALARQNRLQEAEQAFSSALELDPDNKTLKSDLHTIQEQLKDAGPHAVRLKRPN